ncbi:MAG: outer membrane protein assembly factor BamC [Burkholderiales bacterium]
MQTVVQQKRRGLFGVCGSRAFLVVCVVLAGCTGALDGKKIDYKSAGKLPPLEVPPDLAAPASATRYTVPDSAPGDRKTFSEYQQQGKASAVAVPAGTVLPVLDRVKMDRAGVQRWLVVKAPADQVWVLVKDFWLENGFLIKSEEPDIGYMETDWAENRAKIPVGGLTGFLNKALDAVSSLPERDKFRTRLERGADPNVTEIYISHKGISEVYVRERDNNTRWQARPSDPELEATMLARLANRLGLEPQQVAAVAKAADATDARAALVKWKDVSVVSLNDSFDRAWRRVGLALDRVGFMVEDRNRADGVFFVRYQDPEAEAPKKSGVAKLAFWRSDDPKNPDQFRIQVAAAPEASNGAQVRVLDRNGAPDGSDTAKRILALLVEQLK